ERVEQEAELGAPLVLADAERLERAVLQLAAVDTNRATADLDAVEHEVVGAREDLLRGGLELVLVLDARRRERVVRGRDLAVVDLEQRRIGEPHELPLALADQIQLLADVVDADRTEARVRDLRLVGDEDQRVADLRARDAVDLRARLVGEALEALPLTTVLHARPRGLRVERLREVVEAVEDRARQLVRRPGHAQALDDATALHDRLEHAEAAVLRRVRD